MSTDPGWRNVRMSAELVTALFVRDRAGRRLHVEWGDPDSDGFYTPTFTIHYDDVLQTPAWSEDDRGLYRFMHLIGPLFLRRRP